MHSKYSKWWIRHGWKVYFSSINSLTNYVKDIKKSRRLQNLPIFLSVLKKSNYSDYYRRDKLKYNVRIQLFSVSDRYWLMRQTRHRREDCCRAWGRLQRAIGLRQWQDVRLELRDRQTSGRTDGHYWKTRRRSETSRWQRNALYRERGPLTLCSNGHFVQGCRE